jgi:hypothetical protein
MKQPTRQGMRLRQESPGRASCGPSYEKIGLPLSLLDTPASDIEVGLVALDADEWMAYFDARNAGCAGAHEGVKNDLALIASPPNKPVEVTLRAAHRMPIWRPVVWLRGWPPTRNNLTPRRERHGRAEPICNLITAKRAPKVSRHHVGQRHGAEERQGRQRGEKARVTVGAHYYDHTLAIRESPAGGFPKRPRVIAARHGIFGAVRPDRIGNDSINLQGRHYVPAIAEV